MPGSVAQQAGHAHPAYPAPAQHPAAQEQAQRAALLAVGSDTMARAARPSQRPPIVPPATRGLPIPLDQACPPRSDRPPAILKAPLDPWIVPPNTESRRKRGRGPGRRAGSMAQPLVDLVEQFCTYQRKQRGRTEGGVKTYRWNLEQFLTFVRARDGRLARLRDLRVPVIQAWMDEMAASDLGPNTLRCRMATLSSFCTWLVKRQLLDANPVAPIDRPPRHEEPPAVPGPGIMDALIEAARQRGRPRDLAIFLLMRFTGMRRGSVAGLRVRNLDTGWGLRNVRLKGGKRQDIPLPI